MLGRTDYYGDWTENNDTIYLNIKRTRHINSYEATEFIVKELHNENRDSLCF